MSDAFLYLNPFVGNAVHEADIWAEEGSSLGDVEAIHAEVFDTLRRDLLSVAADSRHTTRVRFLVGQGGAGKSHLFSRLRRHVGSHAIFAFASNPPTRPSAALHWTLDKVVFGLRRPRIVGGEIKPYSQLEALLYLLLLQGELGLAEAGLDELNEFWGGVEADKREDYLGRVHRRLVERGYEAQSLRGMLGILRPETRETAFRWLSGSTNLLPEELHDLGQAQPIEDEEAEALLKRLGDLSVLAATSIVLVLDQLDLMQEPAQIGEFQRLLFTLINESRNWCVVVGLIEDNFQRWRTSLTEALRTRLEGSGGGQLPVVELVALSDPAQRAELVRKRLASPALAALRGEERIASELHPLTAADVDTLAGGEALFPRALLSRACRLYVERVERPQPPELLDERMRVEFEERRARIDPEAMGVEKGALADRLKEAVELLALAEGLGPVESSVGPFERQRGFKGTDTVLVVGGRPLRVVGHHVQQGPSFPRFLQHALELPSGSILVRDAAAGISGPVTTKRLEQLRKDKHFLHLPRPAIADLFALGEVLAELREGNLASLVTDPPPAVENVRAALARQAWFRQHPFTTRVLEVLQPTATPPEPAPAAEAPPPESLTAAIQEQLLASRWLVVERLRLRLKRRRIEVTIEELRGALVQPPLSEQVLRYPREVRLPSDVQVLVWNEDAGA